MRHVRLIDAAFESSMIELPNVGVAPTAFDDLSAFWHFIALFALFVAATQFRSPLTEVRRQYVGE